MTVGADRARRPVRVRGPRAGRARVDARRPPSRAGPRRRRPARARAAPGRARDRSNPTAGSPPARRRRSGGTSCPAGVSTRIAGIGRATAARTSPLEAGPPQGRDRGRRREDAAGPPVPRGRPLEDDDVDGRLGRAGRPGPPRPGRRRRSRPRSARSRPSHPLRRRGPSAFALGRTAAIAYRWPNAPADGPDRRQAGRPEQRDRLVQPVRPPDRQRRVVARVAVAGQQVADQPGARASASRLRSRSLTTIPSRATRPISRSSATASAGVEVVEDERGVGDVERAVGVGERPAVADVELEPGRDGHARAWPVAAAASTSGRLSSADDVRACDRAGRRRARSASGMSAPPVPTSRTVRSLAMRRRARRSRRGRRARDPAEPPVDPAQVAQVAGQRDGSSSGPSSSSTASVRRSIGLPQATRRETRVRARIRAPRHVIERARVPYVAMTALRRCLLPLAIAALCLALTAPATAAAASPRFPTQSLGNRGTDVKAIQGLLNERGYPVAVDGVFGATTVDAVKAFQAAAGLPANGIVDDATWAKLIVRVSIGSTRRRRSSAVQRELHAKRHLDPPSRRDLRRGDADGRQGVPEARGPADHGRRQRRDLAPAHLALRAADVQQDRRCATTASATARPTGRRARRSTSSRRRRGSWPGRDTAASRSGMSRSSTAATSPATRPTSAAWTSTSG